MKHIILQWLFLPTICRQQNQLLLRALQSLLKITFLNCPEGDIIRVVKKQAQRFLSAGELIYQHTQPPRHKLLAAMNREMMKKGIKDWKEITGVTLSNQG